MNTLKLVLSEQIQLCAPQHWVWYYPWAPGGLVIITITMQKLGRFQADKKK